MSLTFQLAKARPLSRQWLPWQHLKHERRHWVGNCLPAAYMPESSKPQIHWKNGISKYTLKKMVNNFSFAKAQALSGQLPSRCMPGIARVVHTTDPLEEWHFQICWKRWLIFSASQKRWHWVAIAFHAATRK